jgi:hypothetical protein
MSNDETKKNQFYKKKDREKISKLTRVNLTSPPPAIWDRDKKKRFTREEPGKKDRS